jgi:hypothetical protein
MSESALQMKRWEVHALSLTPLVTSSSSVRPSESRARKRSSEPLYFVGYVTTQRSARTDILNTNGTAEPATALLFVIVDFRFRGNDVCGRLYYVCSPAEPLRGTVERTRYHPDSGSNAIARPGLPEDSAILIGMKMK